MGAGTAVVAFDVPFNREVLDDSGWFFADAEGAARAFEEAEADAEHTRRLGDDARARAREMFRWEDVADAYEDLARRVAQGHSVHRVARKARRRGEDW
jgi:glycosyltransferase involved in cell wall biosynthesis